VALATAAFWLTPLPPAQPSAAAQSTLIFDRNGAVLYDSARPDGGRNRDIPLDEMPEVLRNAVIATEDPSFYDNAGVAPLAILRAAWDNLRHWRLRSGGSTITQQLARNLYLDPGQRSSPSLRRKLYETFLAVRLTASRSKDDILETYLNRIYFGNLAYGVEAAARTYFGKPARDLDLAESAFLAGLPQSPTTYDPFTRFEAARQRQATVLRLMNERGYITPDEREAALAEPLRLNAAPFPIEAPHFVVYVQSLLPSLLSDEVVAAGGLRVYTTLDLSLQRTAQATVSRRVEGLKDHEAKDGALVALDPRTGEVLAMVGSADYFNEAIDGAVNVALAPRQPGSAIKPVVYAAALEAGFTPATMLLDIPTTFATASGQPYAPSNYDRTFHGPVSLREALASSYNVPAVELLSRVGVDRAVALGRAMGLTTFAGGRFDLSLTLGGAEVRLLDLVGAYAVLAAGGIRREPVAVLRVEDARGRVLYQRPESAGERVLAATTAYLLSDILSDNAARSPGFGEWSALRLPFPAAVKTGTTSDFRDNWTVGYTPDLVVGVWVGNADNSPMRDVSGVSGAAPIWHEVMEEAQKGRAPSWFDEPPGLVRREVCLPSGLLVTDWCRRRRLELFVAGTEPLDVDDYYRPLAVCLDSGLPAADCGGGTRERVFEFVPFEAIPWAREAGVALPPLPPYQDVPAAGLPSPAGSAAIRLVSPSPATVRLSRELASVQQALRVEALPNQAARRVELYVDGVLFAVRDSGPFRAAWPLIVGKHTFQARLVDVSGAEAWSDMVTVTVLPP